MAQVVPFLTMASTVMSATSAYAEGSAEKKAADYEAEQLERAATAKIAEGSRQAYERRREGDIIESNARAAMAAGGGSTTDAGMVERLGDIGAQADYNVLSALFESEEEAQGIKEKAKVRRWEGRVAKRRGIAKALGTVMQGGSSFYQGYKPNAKDS